LEERNDEDSFEKDVKRIKKSKLEETDGVEVINIIWALPVEVEFNVKEDVCVYSAVADEALKQNDIPYTCYPCGPSTRGFSCARDLMRHSVCSHDLFPSKVEQGKHYVCDGTDLVQPTQDQYDKYSDGSHRGKKKLESNERAENEKRVVEARTKAGEKAKKGDEASTSRNVSVGELVKRREVQLSIQQEGRAEARKWDELLEEQRVNAERKIQIEEQKASEERKQKIKEQWIKKAKLSEAEEERRREDKVQFNKSLAKTIANEGDLGVAKKSVRRDMTSEELDQEFKDLNASQHQANARLAVDQMLGTKEVVRKEKVAALERRMMRAEGEMGENSRLPPVTEILSVKKKSQGVVENVKMIAEKKGKKTMSVLPPIVEMMELEGGEVEIDFEVERSTEGRGEVSQKVFEEVVREMQGSREGSSEPIEALSMTFLQNMASDKMDVDLGEDYDMSVQQIVEALEQSGKGAGLSESPSREMKEELIRKKEISRKGRKVGDGKVSSESAEEVDRITIEDSVGEEKNMIRTVGAEDWAKGEEEPEPIGEVLTPVMESTPVKNAKIGGGDYRAHLRLKPVIAPKKNGWSRKEQTRRITSAARRSLIKARDWQQLKEARGDRRLSMTARLLCRDL